MVLDLILILIFALAVWSGWRKGFIINLFKFAGLIFPLVIAIFFRKSLADWAVTLPIADKVSAAVAGGASSLTHGVSDLPLVSGQTASSVASVTYIIMEILAILAVFLFTSIIFWLVSRMLTAFVNAIKLKTVNKTGGMLLGIIEGYLYIYIVALAFLALAPFVPWMGKITLSSYLVRNLPNPMGLFYKWF